VVGGNTLNGVDNAFLYLPASGITNLNNHIGGAPGWVLNRAYSINNRGQIVGVGTLNGVIHTFLLTPANDYDQTS